MRNYITIYIGIICVIAFLVVYFWKKNDKAAFKGGVRLADTSLMEADEYYQKRRLIYKTLSWVIVAALMISIMASCVLLARPYTTQKVSEKKYTRDIILCLDISTSVDELNQHLMHELKDVVNSLSGERVGIIIFNTSPVMICPLTDDYVYVVEQIDKIEKALKARTSMASTANIWNDEYWELNSFISDGTLVTNAERGSSLIGDGLASCILNFGNSEEKRTKIVIFSTDNDPYGDEYLNITQAAELCAENAITVYGIGTEEMTSANMSEMKAAVELTGGKFFLEESSGTVSDIVDAVNSQSASLVKGNSYVIETDQPRMAFLILIAGVMVMIVVQKVLKK